MTVINNATADFVLSTRDRLALALDVEKAMTEVCRRLALAFLRSLETCLRDRLRELPGDGWSVTTAEAYEGHDMMASYAYVALRREDWPVPRVEEDDFHCVLLMTNEPNWAVPWVGIYANQAEATLARRLREAATDAIGDCQADEVTPAWRLLKPPLNDWRQRTFLLDAGYPALKHGAEAEPVRELGQQMLTLARAAAPIYDACLPSTARGAA